MAGTALGDWPRTFRVLPWAIASFLAMLWLTPIDSTTIPVQLPFDSSIDRVALVVLALTWLASLGAGPASPRWRSSPIVPALTVFVAIATLSVVASLTPLARQEELSLAIKKLSLLACYSIFFVVVATSVRPSELPAFIVLMLGLASVTAVGTVIEYRSGTNLFFSWTRHLPLLQVAPEPPNSPYGRPSITGPTQHGLAVATMLAMCVPFAIVGLIESRVRTRRLLYVLVLALLLAGAIATLRKTALVVPASTVLVLLIYRFRQVSRLLPLAVLLFVMVHVISPGALGGLRYQFSGGSKASTEGRTSDYAAIRPDVLAHPLLGRGFGTYDPRIQLEKAHPTERHRYLDNELLLLLLETGAAGLIAYLGIGVLAARSIHSVARSRAAPHAGAAVAIIAAIAGFIVSNVLFDTLSFPQVPYLYFFLLGLTVIVGLRRAPAAAADIESVPTDPVWAPFSSPC